MANVALSNIASVKGISTNDSGYYVEYDELNGVSGVGRALKSLEDRIILAISRYDELAADDDGKLIIMQRGAEANVQFTPSTAFRAALVALKDALTEAKTTVNGIQLPLP